MVGWKQSQQQSNYYTKNPSTHRREQINRRSSAAEKG